VTHPHHNYYFGRHESEITSWLDYFLRGMAFIFERVGERIQEETAEKADSQIMSILRPLDHRARRVLGLFNMQDLIQTSDAANLLGIPERQTRDLLKGWVADGWIEIADPSKRGRKYRLAEEYQILL